ncbi:hypothetical protein [Rhizobium oryzicola]|uniref:Antifreeze protein n=1 Tax=Rhizobium oryzicola TaxID=1232668 RepID=A0ABT8SVD6_9HYPH|nr:hypothetical protein [Rhizobium oryzicola]MDO1582388.1 hypothetical protein [Rhizobium oryzicola]
MTNLFAKAGLAVLIAASGFAATLTGAEAASVQGFTTVQWDRGGPPPRHWGPGPDRRDRCSPGLAEEKASRMGLRRARVVDVNPRVVVVAGFDRRGPDRIAFANVRGCPVLRR